MCQGRSTTGGQRPTNAWHLTPNPAHSLDAVLLPPFVTHTFAPSKAAAKGLLPTGKVPRTLPSAALNLVTLALPQFVTQILAPSKATPVGTLPTAKVPST